MTVVHLIWQKKDREVFNGYIKDAKAAEKEGTVTALVNLIEALRICYSKKSWGKTMDLQSDLQVPLDHGHSHGFFLSKGGCGMDVVGSLYLADDMSVWEHDQGWLSQKGVTGRNWSRQRTGSAATRDYHCSDSKKWNLQNEKNCDTQNDEFVPIAHAKATIHRPSDSRQPMLFHPSLH